jgi:hypothetical protein
MVIPQAPPSAAWALTTQTPDVRVAILCRIDNAVGLSKVLEVMSAAYGLLR